MTDWLGALGRRAVIPIGGLLGTRLSGTSVRENMLDPAVKAASAEQLLLQLQPDAVFHVGDVVVEAEALGAPIELHEDRPPEITAFILHDSSDLPRLKQVDIGHSLRPRVTIETIRLLAARLPQAIVLAQVTGPLTIASGLIGYENLLRRVCTDRPFVEKVLEVATRAAVQFAELQIGAGARMLWVGEPMGAVISPSLFADLCLPCLRRLLATRPGWSILHICGDTTPHLERLVETGASVLSLDAAVDLSRVARKVPAHVALMGNLDPVRVLQQGTREEVVEATERLLDTIQAFDNFILSSGCSIPRTAPLENVRAMVQTARARTRRARGRTRAAR